MVAALVVLAQQQQGAADSPGLGPFLPLIIIMMLFWLLLLRPQSQQARKLQEMLAGLKVNDEVVTSGGIVGVVAGLGKDDKAHEVVLRTEGTRIKVLKSAIVQVTGPAREAAKD